MGVSLDYVRTYIQCTDLYRSHSATDQMSVVWAWGGGGGGGGGGWRGGGGWVVVFGCGV